MSIIPGGEMNSIIKKLFLSIVCFLLFSLGFLYGKDVVLKEVVDTYELTSGRIKLVVRKAGIQYYPGYVSVFLNNGVLFHTFLTGCSSSKEGDRYGRFDKVNVVSVEPSDIEGGKKIVIKREYHKGDEALEEITEFALYQEILSVKTKFIPKTQVHIGIISSSFLIPDALLSGTIGIVEKGKEKIEVPFPLSSDKGRLYSGDGDKLYFTTNNGYKINMSIFKDSPILMVIDDARIPNASYPKGVPFFGWGFEKGIGILEKDKEIKFGIEIEIKQ